MSSDLQQRIAPLLSNYRHLFKKKTKKKQVFINDFGLQFVYLRIELNLWFFREQFPIYYAFYIPPNTKHPFWGM